MQVAARANAEAVAQTLMQHGADIEHRALHDVTPLMVAVSAEPPRSACARRACQPSLSSLTVATKRSFVRG